MQLAADPSKIVQIYLPYFFKIGNLFSQDFLVSCFEEISSKNQCAHILNKLTHKGKNNELLVRCSVDPQKCSFRLVFDEEINTVKAYNLKYMAPYHTCKKMTQSDEKRIVTQRVNEIRGLRREIFELLQERFPIYGHQPSKTIMTHLAVRLNRYPNFMVRGVNKNVQLRIRKRFDNQLSRLRKHASLRYQRSSKSLKKSQKDYIYQYDGDSDSYDDSSFIQGTTSSIKK